jgi:predicted Na+-dependent transporter
MQIALLRKTQGYIEKSCVTHGVEEELRWKFESMSVFINKFSTMLIILVGIMLGFLLPSVGMMWKPYLPYLLMLLMFSVSLAIEPKEIKECVKNYPVILLSLFMVFILTPLLALSAKMFFSPTDCSGTMLAFASPSAIATGFWSSVFNGDVAVGLVMSAVTNLLAIVTLPLTMLLTLGTTVTVDAIWMVLNLSEVILIPLAASFLLKRFLKPASARLREYTPKANLIIMILLIWGSIAPGVATVESNAAGFVLLNIFMLIALGLAFLAAYRSGRKYGEKEAITIGIATSVKNAVLALVLGATVFGQSVLPPLIANLIAQNLLLIPLGLILMKPRTSDA